MPIMCGIAGILRAGGAPVAAGELRAMAGALAHRGPDDEGFHRDRGLGLAHRRLAILDLSRSHGSLKRLTHAGNFDAVMRRSISHLTNDDATADGVLAA